MPKVRLVMGYHYGEQDYCVLKASIRGPNAIFAADGVIADFQKLGYVVLERKDFGP
jgi:hypothetical protein